MSALSVSALLWILSMHQTHTTEPPEHCNYVVLSGLPYIISEHYCNHYFSDGYSVYFTCSNGDVMLNRFNNTECIGTPMVNRTNHQCMSSSQYCNVVYVYHISFSKPLPNKQECIQTALNTPNTKYALLSNLCVEGKTIFCDPQSHDLNISISATNDSQCQYPQQYGLEIGFGLNISNQDIMECLTTTSCAPTPTDGEDDTIDFTELKNWSIAQKIVVGFVVVLFVLLITAMIFIGYRWYRKRRLRIDIMRSAQGAFPERDNLYIQ